MIHSFWECKETYTYAGNMLGKDWTYGRIALMAFLTRHPCRGLTTSASGWHLGVLWSEMRNAANTSKLPLTVERGGPLRFLHAEIRKVWGGEECPISYVKAKVAADENVEALQGHHIAKTGDGVWRTFAMGDEASAIPSSYRTMMMTWANRAVWFGNCWDCNNHFKHARAKGPVEVDGRRLINIIHARAEDSPNVQLGLRQRAAGQTPTDEMLVPGLLSYQEYMDRLATFDEEERCVSLDGNFYEGRGARLFAVYLAACARIADELKQRHAYRRGLAIGIDTGEGIANTSMTCGDGYGVIEQRNEKTPDTSVIPGNLIAFGREHGVPPEQWVFDRGGGGYQIACQMRAMGYPVRTVGFGQGVLIEPHYGKTFVEDRKGVLEERGAYTNRRSQMYGEAAEDVAKGYGIPAELAELHRQLSVVPKLRDQHGRLKIPPKHRRKADEDDPNQPSMTELCGRSPDEMDSFVLMRHGVRYPAQKLRAGAA